MAKTADDKKTLGKGIKKQAAFTKKSSGEPKDAKKDGKKKANQKVAAEKGKMADSA